MTINDLDLNQHSRTVHRWAALLDSLTANGKEETLFKAYSEIELAARNAQWMLNAKKWQKKSQP